MTMEETITENVLTRTETKKQVADEEERKFEDELEQLIATLKIRIVVLGCGGGGCNTVTRTKEEGIYGAELIGLNTDAMHLLRKTKANKRILLGRHCTKGLGAGGIPQIGESAASEAENEIKQAIAGSHIAFITCGLGGGTGTGSAPIIAKIARDLNALTIAVVTLPFKAEGLVRMQNALAGLDRLKNIADTVIVIPNDKLLELVPRMSLEQAFKYADMILMRSIKSITEMLTKPGIINVDFADLKTVMKSGGVAMIGMGESEAEDRAKKAIEQALSSPLLDVDITNASGALINVSGGSDMTVEEAQTVVSEVYKKINPAATIIWGTTIEPGLEHKIKVMVVVTGVNSDQIFGRAERTHLLEKNTHGLEFVR